MKERLKTLRKALGLTQREMAEKLVVKHSSHYAKWEQGVLTPPRARLIQICQTFGVRLEWLESGEGEMWEQSEKELSIRELEKETYRRIFFGFSDNAKRVICEVADEWRAGGDSAED